MTPSLSADAVTALLSPLWLLVIGVLAAVATVVASFRLVKRGRSRMGTMLLITGTAVVCLAVFVILTNV